MQTRPTPSGGMRTALAIARSALRAVALFVVLCTGTPALAEATSEPACEASETVAIEVAWRARARSIAAPAVRAESDLHLRWRSDLRSHCAKARVRGAAHALPQGTARAPAPLRC